MTKPTTTGEKKYRARFLPNNRIYWIKIVPSWLNVFGIIKVADHTGTRNMLFKDEKELQKFWHIYI